MAPSIIEPMSISTNDVQSQGVAKNNVTSDSPVKAIVSGTKTTLQIHFHDGSAIFHSQWLHDARCDLGSERKAPEAFCEDPEDASVLIERATVSGSGPRTTVNVTWPDGAMTPFPAVWLRLLAPQVAKSLHAGPIQKQSNIPPGWKVSGFAMPEISYNKIMASNVSKKDFSATKAWILDTLLLDGSPGIFKIVDLPEVDPHAESTQVGNLLTVILKRLFNEVFQHSMRPADATFKIASHYREPAQKKDELSNELPNQPSNHDNAQRIKELPNYDTSEVLLPHADHSHYDNPVRVQGFHAVQGHSENTFLHACAALQTLQDEDPDLYEALATSPYILGRVAQFYTPSLFQTTVDTAIRKMPGYPDQFKAIRWHPHLAGYLLTPFEQYETARRAHRKFQEIMRRDSHQLKIDLKPGDMYVWDNFRILHGRERIFSTPRLAVGQTVIEQVVNDHYRVKQMEFLTRYMNEHWLVQTPTWELQNLVNLIKESEASNA